MKNRYRRSLVALVSAFAVVFSATAQADFPQGSPPFFTDYVKGLTKAKEQGKPVVVVFSAAWCPPCQQMKRETYPSQVVQPLHDKFIWIYIDTDVPENKKAAKHHGVRGIPQIDLLDSKGQRVDQQVGGSSAKAFAKKLDTVLTKHESGS